MPRSAELQKSELLGVAIKGLSCVVTQRTVHVDEWHAQAILAFLQGNGRCHLIIECLELHWWFEVCCIMATLRVKQDVRACVQHAYPVDVVCGVVQHYRGTRTVPFLRTRLNYSNTYYEYY